MGMSGVARFMTLALLIGAHIPASAQDGSFAASKVIKTINQSDLAAAIRHNGASSRPADSEGKEFDVTFENGMTATVLRAGCTQEACMGLLMLAFFNPPAGANQAALDERVRQFNINYNPASAVRSDSGSYVLKNYVIADDGITLGNLARTLSLFEEMVGIFSEEFFDE